jgi:NAD(P)H-nitrite reductase large subunit
MPLGQPLPAQGKYRGALSHIVPIPDSLLGLNTIGHYEEYKEVVPSNLLQIAGLNVFSTGDILSPRTAFIYDNSIYTKLFIENGTIKGAILIGDTKKGFSIKKAIEEKREFSTEAIESDNILNFI